MFMLEVREGLQKKKNQSSDYSIKFFADKNLNILSISNSQIDYWLQ